MWLTKISDATLKLSRVVQTRKQSFLIIIELQKKMIRLQFNCRHL